jgi:hypothetical protein
LTRVPGDTVAFLEFLLASLAHALVIPK